MTTIINCNTGEVTFIPPSQAELTAAAWDALRAQRNSLLTASDWTQVADAPVNQAAWANYRQELRDLPDNTLDPFNPVWPEKPE